MAIVSLNLSMSTKCGADCVFCPEERGKQDYNHMSREVVEKVITEVSSKDFPWEVKTIQVGENGDALLNPAFISHLQYIRKMMPNVFINLTTHFGKLTEEKSRIILKEGLLDAVQTNIDGHDAETFFAQKRLSYDLVIKNIKGFLKAKEETGGKAVLSITVLTLKDYNDSVQVTFGGKPSKFAKFKDLDKGVPDSTYEQVVKSLDWLPKDIAIRDSVRFAWAERSSVDTSLSSKYVCPQLPRVQNEVFISPSGLWYPCCLDDNMHQAYGNVMERTLVEIHESKERALLVSRLENRQFEEIGYPCNTVQACQVMS